MRKFIDKFGIPIIIICVAISGITLYLHTSRPMVPVRTEDLNSAFYVDEETGEESIHSANDVPPLMGTGGKPTVVRAIKYSCDGGKKVEILYYFKYTEAIQEQLQSLPTNDAVADLKRSQLQLKGQLVRAPGQGKEWVPADSKEGEALTALPLCPNGQSAKIVNPQKR